MFYSTFRLTRLQLLSTLVNHVLLYCQTDQTPAPLHPGKPWFTLLSDWPDSSSSPPWLTMFYSTFRLTRLQLLSTLVKQALFYFQTDQTPAPLHPGKPCFTLLSDWPDPSSSPPWKTMFYSTFRLTRLQLLSILVNHVLFYCQTDRFQLLSTLVNHVLLYFQTDQTSAPLHPG